MPQQIFEVALDLGLGAGGAGGAQDDAHALRNLELLGDLAKLLAVVGAGDLAADAAAARGVGHQHAIAAGEREIGRQRRALGAALFLDHLHQHDLPALDDLLDLVLAAIARRALGHLFHRVGAADGFDDLFLFVVAVAHGRCLGRLAVAWRRLARRPRPADGIRGSACAGCSRSVRTRGTRAHDGFGVRLDRRADLGRDRRIFGLADRRGRRRGPRSDARSRTSDCGSSADGELGRSPMHVLAGRDFGRLARHSVGGERIALQRFRRGGRAAARGGGCGRGGGGRRE